MTTPACPPLLIKNSGSIPRNACVACETKLWKVWQTDRQTDGRTDGQTTDKEIPMCRYASQATQKLIKKNDRNCWWGGRPSPLTPATVHCIQTNIENPKAGIITTFSEFACFAFSFYFFRRNRMETIFIYVRRCWMCKLWAAILT